VPVTIFDIWDQALLTDTITLPRTGAGAFGQQEDAPTRLGDTLMPMKTHRSRVAKLRTREIKPFGRAQFRAPAATPPLYKPPGVAYAEQLIELALIDEMERIDEEDILKLNSPDDMIARSVGLSLIERGRILQTRNDRATEWMRWQALLNGALTITYPDGGKIYVDYGYPSGHKLTASTLWSDTTNGDPVADVQTWAQKVADDSGFYGIHVHMNSKTFDYVMRNAKVKALVNFQAAGANSILRPRRQDVIDLFSSFNASVDIVLYDNGFRDTGASTSPVGLTKYLPDGKVLVTTEYSLDGVDIADTLDGQVMVSSGYNSVDIRQGWQAEVLLDQISKNHFFRSASARIPRILIPEAFLVATVA